MEHSALGFYHDSIQKRVSKTMKIVVIVSWLLRINFFMKKEQQYSGWGEDGRTHSLSLSLEREYGTENIIIIIYYYSTVPTNYVMI
jgi:hypothetical protein